MNRTLRFIALALTMMLCMCAINAFAEGTPSEGTPSEIAADESILLMTLGGKPVMLDQVQDYAEVLAQYGYINSAADLADALKYYITNIILQELKVEEFGAEALLGDEYQSLVDSYTALFDEYCAEYALSMLDVGYTQEQYDEAYALALAAYAEMGYDADKFVQENITMSAFEAYISTLPIEITSEAIQAEYDDYIAEQISYFEGNAAMYEYYTNYQGYVIEYMPSGYRGVTHILLSVDDALIDAYENATTDEDKASATAAMIESRKADIDLIYKRLDEGEVFEALIAEYGTDPGMSGANLTNGYPVHADSILYAQEFTDGAFSANMTAVGAVSEPVASGFGIHIIYYLRDIPSGAPEMSAELRGQIENYLYELALAKYFTLWQSEYETVYTDNYSKYIR